jgi:hypothetical protein
VPGFPVRTGWDIGHHDYTSIWFWHRLVGRIPRAPEHQPHIDVRPRGVDHFNYRTDQLDAAAMADLRRAYKALSPVRQMMVATITWLYRGGADKTRPARLPSTWHAADTRSPR